MKRLIIFGLVVVMVLGLTLSVFAAGAKEAKTAETFVLRHNHVLSERDPYHAGFLKWSAQVAERSRGRLKIDVFHSAQLGVEEDIIEQIRQGANIGQNTDSARLGNFVPAIAVMNGPYFVDTVDDIVKLGTLPTVRGWKSELEQKFGIKILTFNFAQSFRQMMTSKPIRRPEDLAGLRIRTPGAPIWQESIRALGATPVAMAFGEMYPALQTRAIDGVELSFTAGFNGKFYEVIRFASETRHIFLINFQIVSSKWFNSLPDDLQKILQEECEKVGLEVARSYVDVIDARSRQEFAARGVTIVPASEIDMAAFKRAGDRAYERLNLLAVRDQIHRELGKIR